ncbi:MAG: hypothetical protein ACLRFE_04630 [Clostridia bacterium]
MAEGAMSAFLTDIGTFFTQAITWLGDVLTEVTSTPALLVMVIAMPVCGFAVGLLSRLIRL